MWGGTLRHVDSSVFLWPSVTATPGPGRRVRRRHSIDGVCANADSRRRVRLQVTPEDLTCRFVALGARSPRQSRRARRAAPAIKMSSRGDGGRAARGTMPDTSRSLDSNRRTKQ